MSKYLNAQLIQLINKSIWRLIDFEIILLQSHRGPKTSANEP